MTEIILSQVQAPDMRFLRRVHSVKFRVEVRSSEIREVLNVESFLQRIERSRKYQESLARQVLLAIPTGKLPKGHPKNMWSDYS